MTKGILEDSDLVAAPYNPRRALSADEASWLRESITQFGDVAGITWNKRSGLLVSGHKRVEQLRKLGAKFKDGAFVLGKTTFPVRVVDWDEAKEKAANVTANNPLVSAGFDGTVDSLLADIESLIGDDAFLDVGLGALADGFGVKLKSDAEKDIELGDGSEFKNDCPACGHRF